VAGNFAYVADGIGGLRIVNVADRKHPFEAGAYTATLLAAQDVAVAGSYAYVADGSGTLHIVNIADPVHPFEAGRYSTSGCVANVAVMDDLAYVGDCDALRVINVAGPSHPTLAGYHELAQAYDVAVTANGLIYVIGEQAGLMILRFHLGPPSADFTASPTSGKRPLTVAFTETCTGADTWLWSFGDGSISPSPTPTHTYTSAGVYTVSLRASNAAGSDTLTRTHYITVSGLSAVFSAGPRFGKPPLTVTFTNQSAGNYTSSLWDFGDDITSILNNPTHTYTTMGVYAVTLTVNGPEGSDTRSEPAFIAALEPSLYLPIALNGYQPRLNR
jgi:PKD repeat protein